MSEGGMSAAVVATKCGFSSMGMGRVRFRRSPSSGGETKERSKTECYFGCSWVGRKRCELDLVSSTSGGFDESRVSEK